GDRAFGGFGRADEFGDGAAQGIFVSLEPPELAVEADAIEDREQEQDRDQALDRQGNDVDHCASSRFVDSSAFSNMANVVCGLRSGLATRTATRSPTRP